MEAKSFQKMKQADVEKWGKLVVDISRGNIWCLYGLKLIKIIPGWTRIFEQLGIALNNTSMQDYKIVER